MKSTFPRPQRGIALLEVLIAVLIFSIGILGLVGLQANSIKNASEAKYRADASFLANEIVGRMWADRAHLDAYSPAPNDWQDRVSAELPSGTGDVVIDNDPNSGQLRATITVSWQMPGGAKRTFVAITQISGA